jgi:UDP-N-acetylmuramoylalanine--D-glutamate ligase
MSIQELGLKGRHTTYNSLAAGIVGNIYGLRKENMREAFSDFNSLEHKMEAVTKMNGVEWINDSKSTNVNSTWNAFEELKTYHKPIIWIAGGIDKGNDYSILEPLVKKHTKALICVGVDNTPLDRAFGKVARMLYHTQNMEDAVKMAKALSGAGDIVLFSPACASFDLFDNYEHRGKCFKDAVTQLV